LKKILVYLAVLFRWLWRLLTTGATVLSSLLFLLVCVLFFLALFYHPEVKVADGTALVLAPRGDIVEQRSVIDPLAQFIDNLAGRPIATELTLQDILDGIDAAARDDRIRLLVVAPEQLGHASLNQLRTIGKAIANFRKSGKKVIAVADRYTQGQYYLASWSDEIYLDPMGRVILQGFGVYRLYIRELLDRLGVNVHVFRVGDFKSALEPLTRDTMSAKDREANQYWLTRVWDLFRKDIADNRNLPSPDSVDDLINNLVVHLQKAGGDTAKMALNSGLVDGLKTRREMEDYLSSLVGRTEDRTTFKQIDLADYLRHLTPSYMRAKGNQDRIGLIIAEGTIVYGASEVGQIGSENLVEQIRQARTDKHVKALVLRINSGGGSAYAAEQIRQELALTRESGKPVVVSMGALGASGAYWLAADADKIVAAPSTLTGSIGIFGVIPTLEESLAKMGVFSDGTGTTKLAGYGSILRPFPADLARATQLDIERNYRRFLEIVHQGRKMDLDEVAKIAKGRIWDGQTALELGLVDQLGTLEDAIRAAAGLASVPEDAVMLIRERPGGLRGSLQRILRRSLGLSARLSAATELEQALARETDLLQRLLLQGKDPGNVYAHCLLEHSRLP